MTITATFAIEDVVPVTKAIHEWDLASGLAGRLSTRFPRLHGIFTAVICPATPRLDRLPRTPTRPSTRAAASVEGKRRYSARSCWTTRRTPRPRRSWNPTTSAWTRNRRIFLRMTS